MISPTGSAAKQGLLKTSDDALRIARQPGSGKLYAIWRCSGHGELDPRKNIQLGELVRTTPPGEREGGNYLMARPAYSCFFAFGRREAGGDQQQEVGITYGVLSAAMVLS